MINKQAAFNQTQQQQKLYSKLLDFIALQNQQAKTKLQERKANLKIQLISQVPNAFLIHNILSVEDCKYILQSTEHQENIQTFNEDGINRRTMRIQVLHPQFAQWMFDVVKQKLVAQYEVDKDQKEFGRLCLGKWELQSINDNLRFCKYDQAGFFKPHYDGTYLKSEDVRTLFTILLYLSQDMIGGETNFYDKGPWNKDKTQVILASVKPVAGSALVFPQNVIHQGAPLISGSKQFVRTDIFYKRVVDQDENNNMSAEMQIAMMQKKEKAQCYLDLAREYQRCKQPLKAVEYYRKAFKLNPALDEMMM